MKAVMNDASISDELERDQKTLDIRKKYKKNFATILSNDRAQEVYDAEDRFKALVRKEMMNRRKARTQEFRKNK